VPGKRSAGSLSWGGINNTYFWVDPSRGIAGVILMQFLPFADPQGARRLRCLRTRDLSARRCAVTGDGGTPEAGAAGRSITGDRPLTLRAILREGSHRIVNGPIALRRNYRKHR
jgi:hypothetical protein